MGLPSPLPPRRSGRRRPEPLSRRARRQSAARRASTLTQLVLALVLSAGIVWGGCQLTNEQGHAAEPRTPPPAQPADAAHLPTEPTQAPQADSGAAVAEPPPEPTESAPPADNPDDQPAAPPPSHPPPPLRPVVESPRPKGEEPWHVLIVGVDDAVNGPVRSDTVMLARLDLKNEKVQLLSIPRDTWMYIPGRGPEKVNHAYAYGGVELTRATVSRHLQVPIHYHVVVNLEGFQNIVDLIGGVVYDVEMPMKYEDPWQDLYIDLDAGEQLLDGERAMWYVRFRSDDKADIGRIRRQQNFMQAVIKQALTPAKLPQIPAMIKEGYQMIATDLGLTEMVRLLWLATSVREQGLTTNLLPGKAAYVDNLSYWVTDLDTVDSLLQNWQSSS